MLAGMLPLVEGMPVALTEHIDKGRQLLKGTEGTLTGLWLDAEESSSASGPDGEIVLSKLPLAAIVKFPHLDDPVRLALNSGRWCVNPSKRAKSQQMWVTRKQLPIVPSFAVTAHSSQGKTLPKAIVDLRIPRGREPITP
eukprot:gene57476-biopygen5607